MSGSWWMFWRRWAGRVLPHVDPGDMGTAFGLEASLTQRDIDRHAVAGSVAQTAARGRERRLVRRREL